MGADQRGHCFRPVIYNKNTNYRVWAAKPLRAATLHIMTPRRRETFPPVTLGHIRGHGCRNLLVYCESLWSNRGAVLNADALPDEMSVRSLCPRMVCTACGLVGADVRPDWSPVTNRRPS
jgi:hypothetical protein